MEAVAGRSLWTKTAALLAVAISLYLVTASSAFAAASYVFEPTLSLTGGCTTSPIDEIPDPGICPGTPGVDHPKTGFKDPNVAIDDYGNIYVVNTIEKEGKAEAQVDVFSAEGVFITEFGEAGVNPQGIAVDSKGNVYLFETTAKENVVKRFSPTLYVPAKGEIKYGAPPVVAVAETPTFFLGFDTALVVDAKDRLYVDRELSVSIFKSAEEGNELVNKEAISGLTRSGSMAVDSVHEKIYVSDKVPKSSVVRVFEMEPPYAELSQDKIEGSATPEGKSFITGEGLLPVGVDDLEGHVFVADVAAKKIYEFEEDGTYLATIEPKGFESIPESEIAVDDGPFSPHPQKEGWLFVPSVRAPSIGHVLAFEPREECKPEVKASSVGDITEMEASLRATINPCGLETAYRLEYVSQQQFEAEEGKSFENESARIAGEGTLPKGGEAVSVFAAAEELEPGTAYVFRVIAKNVKGEVEVETTFKTFAGETEAPVCENEAFRTGPSARLPDCRAYELVTPPSTNGRVPSGGFAGYTFPVLRASPDGNRASFLIEGGSLPGAESAGSFNGDPYLATRGGEGWSSSSVGPSGQEAIGPAQRGLSPDQTYSFWQGVGDVAFRIRYPDGHSELVGRGSLAEDPNVDAERALITEGASHIVFATKAPSAVQLEPNAAPAGTATIYDRSAEGPTRVVSLLPGDKTPKAGENALYLGASEDGEGIAFSIGGSIYLRLHDAETFEVAGPSATFAGVAAGGARVFYLEGGDLFAFDAKAEETIEFSSSGDVTPVNVSSGGARAYFVSPSILTGEPNPEGEKAEGGAENLYLSKEGAISFVAILTKGDVEGGLGLWLEALKKPALDPSRTTPTGTTLLFESRADLTGFESKGFVQIYRYDASDNRLDCLSCSPTDTPPTSDASLQSIRPEQFSPEPAGVQLKIANQSPDGRRAFFQTAEPLEVGDTDEKLDVYEWEEEKVGGCKTEGGCVYLISGGHSASPDYLFAMSSSGDDVFFRASDTLLPRDLESTLSIYDARVGGGFAEPPKHDSCAVTNTCQPAPTSPPSQLQPTTSAVGPDGNMPSPGRKCPKGKHAVKKGGQTTCVKKHRKHHKHRTGSSRKGGAK